MKPPSIIYERIVGGKKKDGWKKMIDVGKLFQMI
jgi:hypothetical protein